MPSTVDSNVGSGAIFEMPQRKIFYANDLWWVFYSDATNMVYRTSADGVTWSGATIVRAAIAGDLFSVRYFPDYNTTFVYYVYASSALGESVWFRRGTISGASITWQAFETEAVIGFVTRYKYNPNIGVGTDGKLYVGVDRGTSTNHRWVLSSCPNNDGSGTWTLDAVFSSTAIAYSGDWYEGSFEPLTAGKMLAVFGSDAVAPSLRSRYWDGSTWAAEVTVVSDSTTEQFGVVVQGDVGLVTYVTPGTDYKPRAKKWTADSWGGEETISNTVTLGYVNVAIDRSTGDAWAFWEGPSNTISYAKRVNSTGLWGSTTQLVTGETDLFGQSIIPNWQVYYNKIGVAWVKGISPSSVRFDALTISRPSKLIVVRNV